VADVQCYVEDEEGFKRAIDGLPKRIINFDELKEEGICVDDLYDPPVRFRNRKEDCIIASSEIHGQEPCSRPLAARLPPVEHDESAIIEFTFGVPVRGLGFCLLDLDAGGAKLEAFDADGELLGTCSSIPHRTGRVFVGLLSDQRDIALIRFDSGVRGEQEGIGFDDVCIVAPCSVDICDCKAKFKRSIQGLRYKASLCRGGEPIGQGWRVCAMTTNRRTGETRELCGRTTKKGRVKVLFKELTCGDVYDTCVTKVQDDQGNDEVPCNDCCKSKIIACVP